MQPLPVRLLGTGVCLPDGFVDAVDIDQRLGLASGTTERRHGVARRPVATPGETAIDLGAQAAQAALKAAGLQADALDTIVSASSVPHQAIPTQAALLQRALGLGTSGTTTLDINASCLSFLAALDLLAPSIALGRINTALIVCSELPSIGIDDQDPMTSGLFGDGAAAVVIGRSSVLPTDIEANTASQAANTSMLLGLSLATWSEHADCCSLPCGGTGNRIDQGLEQYLEALHFRMEGRALYRAVRQRISPFFDDLLSSAGVARHDIDLLIPHQASGRALAGLTRHLALDPKMIVNILCDHGNQVAASLPTALHHAITSGRLVRGATVALLGTGAGVSLGGAILRY